MRYKGNNKGIHEYDITLEHRLVAPIWINKLLETKALINKIIFKQNKLGITKLKVYISSTNHNMIMQDIDSKVQIDMTRFNKQLNS